MTLSALIIGWIVIGLVALAIVTIIGLIIFSTIEHIIFKTRKFLEWQPASHMTMLQETRGTKMYINPLFSVGRKRMVMLAKEVGEVKKSV